MERNIELETLEKLFVSFHCEQFNEVRFLKFKFLYYDYFLFSYNFKISVLPKKFYFSDIASGTSTDWVKGVLGVKYVFSYEFRDKGQYGFILPPEQIIPNAQEVVDSIEVILDEASKWALKSLWIKKINFGFTGNLWFFYLYNWTNIWYGAEIIFIFMFLLNLKIMFDE